MYKKFVIAILMVLSSVVVAQDEYTTDEGAATDETATEETITTEATATPGMERASLIPAEASFKGTFTGWALKIDGRLEGKATLDDAVEITDIGEVKGTVETSVGTVKGRIDGTIWASEELYLTSTAIVTGDAMCRNLVVEKGALMSTKTSMGEVKVVEGKKTLVPTKSKARKSTRQRRTRSRSYY